MSRFYQDEAGRVIERATGLALGRVITSRWGLGDAIYCPRGVDGGPVGRATMVRDVAMLAVVREARPGETITLWDLA